MKISEINVTYKPQRADHPYIAGSWMAADIFRDFIPNDEREHFVALFLNTKHRVRGFYRVSIGTMNACQVTVREVFRPAIIDGAVAIIIGHNHPSGDLTPSMDDIALTTRLKEAGELLGVKVVDHIIINHVDDKYTSFVEKGYMK